MGQRKKRLKLVALLALLVTAVQGCANSQVELNGECVDCNSIFYGCTQCSFRSDSIESLQCDTCDFGYFLLSVSSSGTPAETTPDEDKTSMCVQDCSAFAYNFVNNWDLRRCEYCGPTCLECSPKYGCLDDYMLNRGFKTVGADQYPVGEFPFSDMAPSAEFITTKACSDSRCDECQTLDAELPATGSTSFLQCDSCFKYVNFYEEAQQKLLKCDLCDSDSVENCLNCDPDDPNICLSCKADFYLDKIFNECLACDATYLTQEMGCKRCDGTSCLECLPGYFMSTDIETGIVSCQACELDDFNAQYFLEPNRCSQCVGEEAKSSCRVCDIGFLGSLSNPDSCELKCDIGQYPSVTFTEVNFNENIKESTECLSCDISCVTCAGPDSDDCLSCDSESELFLMITDILRQTGTCSAKADAADEVSIDIFVTHEEPSWSDSELSDYLMEENIGLSFGMPFYQLDDALLRAKELAGQYLPEVTVQVTIHLFKGDHYLVENRGQSTLPYYERTQAQSGDNLNYSLTIMPLLCSVDKSVSDETYCFETLVDADDFVTLYSKRREKFRIDVPVSLTLKNVVIDALDSILHTQELGTELPSCLSEYRNCCSLDKDTGVVSNSEENTLTTDTFDCAASFETLFTTMETDCFANWPRSLFKMRLTDTNGDITEPNELVLESTQIRNIFYSMNSLVAFTSAGGQVTFDTATFDHITTCGSLVKDSFKDLGKPKLSDYVGEDYLTEDQVARIEQIWSYQDTFGGQSQLEYYMDTVSDDSVCDSLTYCTTVLIQDHSKFEDIPFGNPVYTGAKLVNPENGLRNLGYIVTLDKGEAYPSSLEIFDSEFNRIKAPYDGCATYESLVAIDQTRVVPEASTNNFRQLFNSDGDFNNAQVEGPIVIRDHSGPVVISDSSFADNISYQGVVSVEQKSGAIWLQTNSLSRNAALFGANALTIVTGSGYDSETDDEVQCGGIYIGSSNTFNSNIGCAATTGALLAQCVGANGWDYNSVIDTYSFEPYTAMPLFSSLEDSSLSTTVSSTTSQVQETISSTDITIEGNGFEGNVAGTDTSVVEIQGFLQVSLTQNLFEANENFIPNLYILRDFSPLYDQQSDKTIPAKIINPEEIRTRAKSIVHVRGLQTLEANDNNMINNYVIDGYSPYASAGSIQSNAFLITDMSGTGTVDFSDSLFRGNRGISGNNRAGVSPTPAGFSSRLIAFHRCQISDLNLDNVTFQTNTGVQQVGSVVEQQAQLFSLEQEIFTEDMKQIRISGLALKGNIFTDSGSIVTFKMEHVYLSEPELTGNKGDSILEFQLPNDYSTVQLLSPYVSANTISKGAVLKIHESLPFRRSFQDASPGSGFYHFKITGATFTSNQVDTKAQATDHGPKTSCIDFETVEQEGWAAVYIGGSSTFSNNEGVLTNEIYVGTAVQYLKINDIDWNGSIKETSDSKMAQFLYKPAANSFQLEVTSSVFECTGVIYDEDIILQNDIEAVQGRPSLFRLGQAENIEKLPLLLDEVTSRVQDLPDGWLNGEAFTMKFQNNRYEDCHHVDKGAIFYLEEGARLQDQYSRYRTSSALSGGLAYLTGHGTYLKIKLPSKTLSSFNAYQGAMIYAEKGATAEITGSVTLKYSEAYEGAIAYVHDRARIIMYDNINISYNKALKRGLFVVQNGSQIFLKDAKIERNTIGLESAIVHWENNRVEHHLIDGSVIVSKMVNTILNSYLSDTLIENNEIEEEGRLLTVIDSNITVSRITSQRNTITTVNYGIYVSYGELTLSNSTFIGTDDYAIHVDLANDKYNDVNGAFLQVQEKSTVVVEYTSFYGGRSVYGGCVLLEGYSRMEIRDSSFKKCTGQYGGAIYASSHLSLYIYDTIFEDNFSYVGMGQNIYSQQAVEQLKIKGCTFRSYHNSIYTSGFMFSMKSCTLEDDGLEPLSSSLPYRSDGGGVYIEQTAKVIIDQTNFKGLQGRYGGALYIHQERLSTTALTKGLGYPTLRIYSFTDLTFEDCSAEFDGGAIYVKDPLNMRLSDSTFLNNKATQEGGAINYVCEPSPTERELKGDNVCSLQLDDIQFTSNSANVGGAIRWNLLEMEVDGKPQFVKEDDGTVRYGTLRFQANKAVEYGPEIASVARELIKFGSVQTYLNYYNGTSEDRQMLVPKEDRASFFNNYVYEGVQSGGDVPTIFLGLIDKYGQLVTINRGSIINFKLNVPKVVVNEEFATQILGVTNFSSFYGTYNMSGMGLLTAPGNQIIVTLKVFGIDLKVPSNRDYLQKEIGSEGKSLEEYALKMEMKVRDCILGEGLKKSGACYECPAGTYLLEAPKVPTECQSCNAEKTYCLGGLNVGPKPGYWRQSASSYNFYACPEKDQCLGMDPELPYDHPGNAVGLCDTEKGYYGVMCTSCLPGFKRAGLVRCEPCQSTELIKIIAIMVGMTIGICLLVRMTIRGAVKASDSSVFNKILMNHLQMLIITSDFDMSWPPQVLAIFDVAAPINSITEAIVNFDCFMDTRKIKDVGLYDFDLPENEIRVYSQKVLIMAGLPIILGFLSFVIWWIICRITHTMEQMQTKFIATLVLLLFLVHPAMTKRMVDVFNCRDYDGVNRLSSDYQVKCYEDTRHIQIAYYVALPCLIIWGLGIPATVYTMMAKNKDKLSTVQVKQQFGFLYNGYKRHNYYWEIVIMYRKIMCIFIAVFLRSQGVIVQALVLLIMLGGFLQANNSSRPFKQRQLNDIENMSVATQIITIYCGVFYISAKERDENFDANQDFQLTEGGSIMLVTIIAACNALFLLFWIMKFLEIGREMIKKFSKRLYVFIFLCGRWDKLEKEAARRAGVIKRERIIAVIEDSILFLKKMKGIYANNIYYEDHDRFLRLLYQVENEQRVLDLTEKRNNWYIQGPKARHRKFDRERMKELQNEQSLEVEDNVVNIMEMQRDEGRDQGRITDSPFLDSQKKMRTRRPKKNDDRRKRLDRLKTFVSMRTIGLDSSPNLEVSNSPSILDVETPAKSNFSQGGSFKLRPQKATSIDMDSMGEGLVESEGDKKVQFWPQPDPTSLIDHIDHLFGEEDDEPDEEEFSSQKKSKKLNAEVEKPKKKKKKKNNQLDLEVVRDKSRNAKTNIIKPDKKNKTVGKILQHDLVEHSKSIGLLAESLQRQGFISVQEKKIQLLGAGGSEDYDELNQPSHIVGYEEVESLDSQEQRLHIVRQLSDRPLENKKSNVIPEAAKSQVDSASNADASARRGSLGSGPQFPLGSIDGSARKHDEFDSAEKLDSDGAVEEEKDKKVDTAANQDDVLQPQDLGPAALLAKKKQEAPTDEESAYTRLRPRNIPRRHLDGFTIVDSYLNKSDSFKTIVDEEDGVTTNKSGAAADSVIDQAPHEDDEEQPSTPKKSMASLSPEKSLLGPQLEVEFSPNAKFNLQMSPGKEKAQELSMQEHPAKPKSNVKEPHIHIEEHGELEVPLFDDMSGDLLKLPQYKPNNMTIASNEFESSPAKSEIQGEEELKVFDASKSSLQTDSDMKDYDYMIEPDQFNFYKPPHQARKVQESIGDGLGVVGATFNYTAKTGKLFDSTDSKEDLRYGDKSVDGGRADGDGQGEDILLELDSGEDPSPMLIQNDRRSLLPGLRKSQRQGFTSK